MKPVRTTPQGFAPALEAPTHIIVRKTTRMVEATDGVLYLRRGAQCLPVKDHERIEQLRRNKGLTSYESHAVDREPQRISESAVYRRFHQQVVPRAEAPTWLRKNDLIRDQKPTVAGILLFDDLPQAVLPKRAGVKVYRYQTDRETGTRETLVGQPQSVEGCAYDLIKLALSETRRALRDTRVLRLGEFQRVEYPPETLHEVITNAVIHRDYSLADDIHIRIFENRIEVESPGTLPAHITPENILDERFARNGQIVRVLNKFPDPPNKDVGEGLNTAFDAMRKLQLREPQILVRDASVLVSIRHERLASAEALVIQHLQSHDSITNEEARRICSIQDRVAMKDVFVRLRRAGKIQIAVGPQGKKTAWELTPLPGDEPKTDHGDQMSLFPSES